MVNLNGGPFIPPPKVGCPINEIPNELLSHIFYLGTLIEQEEEEDSDDEDLEASGWETQSETFSLGHDFGDTSPSEREDEEPVVVDEDDSMDEGDSNERYESMDGDEKLKKAEDTLKAHLRGRNVSSQGDESRGRRRRRSSSEPHSSPSTSPSPDGDLDVSLSFAVICSHVCKHWRAVSLTTPSLWTNIVLGTQRPPFESAAAYLERSKGLPVDISMDTTVTKSSLGIAVEAESENDEDEDPPDPLYYETEQVNEFVALIVPHAARWRTLCVEVPEYEHAYRVLTALAAIPVAPLLRTLQIYHYMDDDLSDDDTFDYPDLRGPHVIFPEGGFPELRSTAFWGVHIDWSRVSFHSQLKELELAYHAMDVRPTWDDFTRLLRESPELRTLTLSSSGPNGDPRSWDTEDHLPLPLPNVTDLVLAFHRPEYIEPLMRKLSFPALTALALDFDGGDFTSFVKYLASGGPRSLLAGIVKLKIGGLPCAAASADVLYEHLNLVTSLNLQCRWLEPTFFEKLCLPCKPSASRGALQDARERGTVPMYCPRLQELTTSEVDGTMMRRCVEARKAAGCPLAKVTMSEDSAVTMPEETWLRDNLETLEFYEPSDEEDEEEVEMEEDEEDF